jgi:hypothetical protein
VGENGPCLAKARFYLPHLNLTVAARISEGDDLPQALLFLMLAGGHRIVDLLVVGTG